MNIRLLLNKINWNVESLPNESTITFLNPYSYFILRNEKIIEKFDYVGIDGVLLKVILNWFSRKKISRISFDQTSLAPKVFDHCINKKKSIFFIGSTEAKINDFVKVIQKHIPKLWVVGFRNGYFSSILEKEKAIKDIILMNPDIVVVGMGTPFQEKFILDLKSKGYKGTSFSCGGYFHQTIKEINYYPAFYDKYNLRWVYRIFDEPKLLKRYFVIYPISIFFVFKDLLRNK